VRLHRRPVESPFDLDRGTLEHGLESSYRVLDLAVERRVRGMVERCWPPWADSREAIVSRHRRHDGAPRSDALGRFYVGCGRNRGASGESKQQEFERVAPSPGVWPFGLDWKGFVRYLSLALPRL
jgi:hypothetical protein